MLRLFCLFFCLFFFGLSSQAMSATSKTVLMAKASGTLLGQAKVCGVDKNTLERFRTETKSKINNTALSRKDARKSVRVFNKMAYITEKSSFNLFDAKECDNIKNNFFTVLEQFSTENYDVAMEDSAPDSQVSAPAQTDSSDKNSVSNTIIPKNIEKEAKDRGYIMGQAIGCDVPIEYTDVYHDVSRRIFDQMTDNNDVLREADFLFVNTANLQGPKSKAEQKSRHCKKIKETLYKIWHKETYGTEPKAAPVKKSYKKEYNVKGEITDLDIGDEEMATFFIAFLFLFIIYFLPTIIAFRKNHPLKGLVLILNLIFGVTVFGWFIALIIAKAKTSDDSGFKSSKNDGKNLDDIMSVFAGVNEVVKHQAKKRVKTKGRYNRRTERYVDDSDMITCPRCAEKVSKYSRKCSFCYYRFDDYDRKHR